MPSFKHLNPSYNRFYALITSAILVVLGSYLPLLGLSTSAYVGNKTMMNFGSYMISMLVIYVILHLLWLLFFLRGFAFVKSGEKNHTVWIYNLRHQFEYKLTLWVWVTVAALLLAFLISTWVPLISLSGVGFSGEFKLASSDLFIGSTGTYAHHDDLFQVSTLISSVLSIIAVCFFVRLNSMLLFFGNESP